MENEGNLRRCERRHVDEHTFALLRNSTEVLGTIRDISRNGLCFEYVNFEHTGRAHGTMGSASVNMLVRGGGFFVREIPCRVVYDIPLRSERGMMFNRFEMRKCGVEFQELSAELAARIEHFLATFGKKYPRYS